MMAAVGLVLLVTCTNLAGLMLARATDRRKEIAIRLAMGANRLRLIRQLLTESILLSFVGGAAGLLLALWILKVLLALKPPIDFPLALDVSVDWRVLLVLPCCFNRGGCDLWSCSGVASVAAESPARVERHGRAGWRSQNSSSKRSGRGPDRDLARGPDRGGSGCSHPSATTDDEPGFQSAGLAHDVVRSRFTGLR